MASKTAKKKPGKSAAPATRQGYPDLHDHIEALKRAGLLIVVDRKINKDTREEFASYLKEEFARWAKVIKQSGARVD